MAHDFFLIERASQLQRLRGVDAAVRLEIPGKLGRSGFSPAALKLFALMDRIDEIPLDRAETGFMPWLRAQRDRLLPGSRGEEEGQGVQLAKKHREALQSFEKQVVRDLLGDDPDAQRTAHHIVSVLVADYPRFIGWKPLQFHDDSFSHEFLFPSWLNLYTVLATADGGGETGRFTGEQIQAVFQFLEDHEETIEAVEDEVLGVATFAARRLPVEAAHRFVQRLLDLGSALATRFASEEVPRWTRLRELLDDGEELLPALQGLVSCDACPLVLEKTWKHRVMPKRQVYLSLPGFLATAVRELPGSDEDAGRWASLVRHLGRIIDQAGGLDSEFVELVEQQASEASDWMTLAAQSDGESPLAPATQRMLARLVGRDGRASPERYAPFARALAPRMELFSPTTWAVFEGDFVESDANREFVLRNAESESGRRRVVQQLLKAAQAARDTSKLLGRLHLAAVMDPACDNAKLRRIGRTLKVLATLQSQGFISTKQYEELMQDLRERLPESAEFLATPLLGGREAVPQLARLYLALNEVCEVFDHTREVVNFGITKAAFSHLDWDDED